MRLNDEIRQLRTALDDYQVVVKTHIEMRDRVQDRLNASLDNMHARLAGMENDLAIIKECLVSSMRSSQSPSKRRNAPGKTPKRRKDDA